MSAKGGPLFTVRLPEGQLAPLPPVSYGTALVPLALNLPVKSHLQSGYWCQTVVTTAVRIRTLSAH